MRGLFLQVKDLTNADAVIRASLDFKTFKSTQTGILASNLINANCALKVITLKAEHLKSAQSISKYYLISHHLIENIQCYANSM